MTSAEKWKHPLLAGFRALSITLRNYVQPKSPVATLRRTTLHHFSGSRPIALAGRPIDDPGPTRGTSRAEQYVRMSTDHQKYPNQDQQNSIVPNATDRGPYRRAPTAHRLNIKWHPQEREHSDAEGGTRDPSAATRPVKRVPGNGAVIATPACLMTAGTLSRVPPARSSLALCARDRSRRPRRCAARFTTARCGASSTRSSKMQQTSLAREWTVLRVSSRRHRSGSEASKHASSAFSRHITKARPRPTLILYSNACGNDRDRKGGDAFAVPLAGLCLRVERDRPSAGAALTTTATISSPRPHRRRTRMLRGCPEPASEKRPSFLRLPAGTFSD